LLSDLSDEAARQLPVRGIKKPRIWQEFIQHKNSTVNAQSPAFHLKAGAVFSTIGTAANAWAACRDVGSPPHISHRIAKISYWPARILK
jgi:hypothetical protein